ncbi:2-aminoethylphosphonate--pyruvate transaminase [Syntrophobacter fumaroxidans]|uniref:2-aminoethylphosphonate--pyruvate transaminase n=1 Tax=Syntrophobacter fumaroxidans (strain DSM 10017 / MPOB) TaxID=335543 RepID=PHNW_SYNFM|nr:2-aminoethylphosphonate--pyruvate transaminase [Syntrophobacter fumaroxidans]A0LMC0.1 RecName: Full=2-aminoethylphosphonate--pyruvate transaminase; AltName: Full=2-aminoethylphosphonate aminotransferase; AltName: Full=AEP transaminase; Short=AEPT [Syntrophobacter fumaroxidans MPOB]ABK18572.1 2-aminoethylphosphonate--pyruvate transaminase [Syntrophobacter fumaroxidans MPOB]
MAPRSFPENPYILLTPGPLSTSPTVKAVMMRDWCTWDRDYNAIVQDIRERLVALATAGAGYTSVLMQGSGTFAVEAALGTALPHDGKLLVISNGHYGDRMALIAGYLGMRSAKLDFGETGRPDPDRVRDTIESDPAITHVAVVHCETTTGMLNPVEEIGRAVKSLGRVFIVDAMSSFGGIPMDIATLGADFLISSANKCIQGVPGFGFVIARRSELEQCAGRSRSLSLDLFQQWKEMETKGGKWRFTSPTHVVRAFAQALNELDDEGGVACRNARYRENRRILTAGMRALGFECLLPEALQSPIITSFLTPGRPGFNFNSLYQELKSRGFVIYPGKVSEADTFRIGTIGHVFPEDMHRLVKAAKDAMHRFG